MRGHGRRCHERFAHNIGIAARSVVTTMSFPDTPRCRRFNCARRLSPCAAGESSTPFSELSELSSSEQRPPPIGESKCLALLYPHECISHAYRLRNVPERQYAATFHRYRTIIGLLHWLGAVGFRHKVRFVRSLERQLWLPQSGLVFGFFTMAATNRPDVSARHPGSTRPSLS
jgi:hypothetical protein